MPFAGLPFGSSPTFRPFALGDPQPLYRNINTSNGLPSAETYHIIQDRKGIVWIATDRGVVRYDGFRFQTLTTKNGLSDDVIFRLYEDYKGRIWFISFNGLLSYWENGRIRSYRYNDRIKRFMGYDKALYKTLLVDKKDNIYYVIGTSGALYISSRGKTRQLHSHADGVFLSKVLNNWFPIAFFSTNKLPFGVYVKENGRQQRLYSEGLGLFRMASSENCLLINEKIYDLRTRKNVLTAAGILGIDEIGGELAIGLFEGGVRFERMHLPVNHPDRTLRLLKGHSVSSVMRDREGGYWFTTLDNGVYYTSGMSVRNYGKKQGLYHIGYAKMTGMGPDVYIVDSRGCTKLTAPFARMQLYGIPKNPVIAHSRNKLFLSGSKISSEKPKDKRYIFLSPGATIAAGYPDYVLAGSSPVVRVYENGRVDTLFYRKYAMRNQEPAYADALVETPEGNLFAGSTYGMFELSHGQLSNALFRDTLFRQRVLSMAFHPRLKTIVGTRGKGIYCFDEHFRITHRMTEKEGLCGDIVNCIYIDAYGVIYVGTNRGLSVLKYAADGTFTRWNLRMSQGLPSNEINAVYRWKEKLWVATRKGIALCDLRQMGRYPRGIVRLAEVSIDGMPGNQRLGNHLLPATVQRIRITLRTDNFSGYGRHRFMYRLRKDGAWFHSNDPEIILNEPRSGDYQVSVRFLNDGGNWSKVIPLVWFTVDTPFYVEWYFIALVSFGLLLIFFWIFKTILKRVRQRHAYQTTINQLEQKALRAQMNPHFIFNSLNSIQSFLIYEENEKAERYLLKFAQLIRQTLNNSRESYITIEAEIDTLGRYLELERMRFKDKFNFEIVSLLSTEAIHYGIPPMLIQPFVENAVLHGFRSVESGGRVEVRFESLEGIYLTCVVEDNGVGRKSTARIQEEGHKSFGTRITAERLAAFKEKYGDDFTIAIFDKETDGKPSGTKVTLKIPVVPPHEITSTDDI